MQDAVHRPEGREERPGLLGGDLGHLVGGAAEHPVGEGREPRVLVGAQPDGEDAATAVARCGHVGAVRPQAPQQGRVVAAGLAQERPQRLVGLRAGRRREDARPRVGRPARMPGVDDGDGGPQARQLVGQGQAHQARPRPRRRHSAPRSRPRVHQAGRPAASMRSVEALRTPEERFAELPGFPFAPRFATLPGGLRMHYVDEGPAGAEAVLLLHGQPTWSYLYRTVVARLAERGLRAVAPDLIGFGRSDKPAGPDGAYGAGPHRLGGRVRLRGRPRRTSPWSSRTGAARSGSACWRRRPGLVRRVVAANTALHTADPGLAGRLAWACHAGPGRHGHGGADAARLPAPHPGARPVPAQPLRPGGHRVGGAGPRCWRPTTPRTPTSPSAPGRASSPCSWGSRPTAPAHASNRRTMDALAAPTRARC